MVLMNTGPSPGCFSASNHFPPKASQWWIFKDLKKDEQRSSPGLTSHALRRAEQVGILRNTTRRRSQTPALCTHQGMCVNTSSANTFLLARVPKPLHSQFLFPGRALWVFLFISTPILPGQRTTLTPEQAPRQVVQGARECCLIRGKDEK